MFHFTLLETINLKIEMQPEPKYSKLYQLHIISRSKRKTKQFKHSNQTQLYT